MVIYFFRCKKKYNNFIFAIRFIFKVIINIIDVKINIFIVS